MTTQDNPESLTRGRSLFLAITIPDDILPGVDDPDDVADELLRILNQGRVTQEAARRILDGTFPEDGLDVEKVMVNAIPSPQWLTRETLDNLRAAASKVES